MIWFVHRNAQNVIVAAFSYDQPGYADEQLDDQKDPGMMAYIQGIGTVPVLTVDQKLAAIGLTITDIQGAIVEAQTKSPVAIPDPNTAPVAQAPT